jgi:hypothetical protein
MEELSWKIRYVIQPLAQAPRLDKQIEDHSQVDWWKRFSIASATNVLIPTLVELMFGSTTKFWGASFTALTAQPSLSSYLEVQLLLKIQTPFL